MSADDIFDKDTLGMLAMEALREKMDRASDADSARAEGIIRGAELAKMEAEQERKHEALDRVLATVERIADKVFERLDASAMRDLAKSNPPPKANTADDDDARADEVNISAEQGEAIMAAIAQRAPAEETAKLLYGVGVRAEGFDVVVAQFRKASDEWSAHLDEKPEWLTAVKLALEGMDDDPA